MTIAFEKKIELTGETWFHIRVDGNCIKSFTADKENEAAKYYKEVVQRAKNGGEITEILAEETITPKQ